MRVDSLYLQHFRNYQSYLLTFSPSVSVLVGKNAAGKTNVLEAIYLLATGESFRAQKIDEMVSWGSEVAHVAGKVRRESPSRYKQADHIASEGDERSSEEEIELKTVLTRGIVNGEKARKRQYMVNGVARQKQNLVGNLTVVSFLPTDLQLIIGSPSQRRAYLDAVLCQIDREYQRSLLSYEKGLRQRNRALDLIREGKMNRSALLFWDQLLIREGEVLVTYRQHFIDFINDSTNDYRIIYDCSTITKVRLEHYAREEVLLGYTMIGPHKDDFAVEKKTQTRFKDLSAYGSRGEQRMGVLWLKMSQLDYMEKRTMERPVLLLDDIFSELDVEHENLVWELARKQQTVITTTDLHQVHSTDMLVIPINTMSDVQLQ